MSVFTYTAANTEVMTTGGQVVTNANADFIKDVAATRASNSFLSVPSVIQTALWFPAAFLLTGIATALTITSAILIVMLNLRDNYWPTSVR